MSFVFQHCVIRHAVVSAVCAVRLRAIAVLKGNLGDVLKHDTILAAAKCHIKIMENLEIQMKTYKLPKKI